MNYKVLLLAITLFLASSGADKCYQCLYLKIGEEIRGSPTCVSDEGLEVIDCHNGCMKGNGRGVQSITNTEAEATVRGCAPPGAKLGCHHIPLNADGIVGSADRCICTGDHCNGAFTINTPQVVTVLVVSAVIALATQY